MFLGTHVPRLDEKGRLFLPARFRDELMEGLVITKGQEGCLIVYPNAEFDRIADRLHAAPMSDKPLRNFARVFFSSASREMPDKQGRVTIPPPLRAYAGLRRDCVVIGAGARVEIWDAEAWERFLAEQEQDYSEVTSEVLRGLL